MLEKENLNGLRAIKRTRTGDASAVRNILFWVSCVVTWSQEDALADVAAKGYVCAGSYVAKLVWVGIQGLCYHQKLYGCPWSRLFPGAMLMSKDCLEMALSLSGWNYWETGPTHHLMRTIELALVFLIWVTQTLVNDHERIWLVSYLNSVGELTPAAKGIKVINRECLFVSWLLRPK